MNKLPKILKIVALGWVVVVLALVIYRQSQGMIFGKWYDEDYGMMVISSDGTLNVNGTPGRWKEVGYNRFEIELGYLGGGYDKVVKVTRGFGTMTWEFERQVKTFEKLPDGEVASIDKTLEVTPEATLILRWTEREPSRRLVVLPDRREGFDDDFIRLFLNSKYGLSLTPEEWLSAFTAMTRSGKMIGPYEEIPGFPERPPQNMNTPAKTIAQTPTGLTKMIRHSYRQIGGVLYRLEATFEGRKCLEMIQTRVERDVGDAHYWQ